jgi:drug/metabolite transporter (DMT)-like permease
VTLQEFGLLMLSIITGVTGQFFLKTGALKLGKVHAGNAYILLLTRVKLSVVGPSIALSYVFSVMLGYFLFKESIPFERLLGLGFIVCGVILVVWQKA